MNDFTLCQCIKIEKFKPNEKFNPIELQLRNKLRLMFKKRYISVNVRLIIVLKAMVMN